MKNKSSGFTLIELMIAVTILTMLLFTGSYVYQMLASRWDKELGSFNQSAKQTKSFILIKNLLKGIHPFIVWDKKLSGEKKPSFFFIGSNDSLLSVSRAGLFVQQYPEIFRIKALEKESGLFDLVYQSTSTQNTLLLYAQQEIIFEHQITLLSDITEIKFKYLGWNGFMERGRAEEEHSEATWRDYFSGIDNQLLPEKMIIYVKQDQKELEFSITFDVNSLRFLSAYIEE